VPVRIIFRGLMLFQIPESEPKKLLAYMVNNPNLPGGSKPDEHAHYHRTEIQILAGKEQGLDPLAKVPKVLNPKAALDIIVGEKGVKPSRSFSEYIPNLAKVIEKATIPGYSQAKPTRNPSLGDTLIQNIITVDGGIVRARNVTTWDEGGYPLSGKPADGVKADLPAKLKFMGSSVRGHMATDVVVEIPGDKIVALKNEHRALDIREWQESDGPRDPDMPPGTVEILVTNYEPPMEKPIPWGLDFQWLFEAAGYPPTDLSKSADDEFKKWVTAAEAYDPGLFKTDFNTFFPNGPMGSPFPYIQNAGDLTELPPLHPLTRPLSVFACKGAVIP